MSMTSRNGPTHTLLRSPTTVIAVSLPVMLWVAVACFIGDGAVADMASARTFRVYLLVLALLIFIRSVDALLRRSFAGALIQGGLFLLLMQGVVWYGFRFTGEAGAGTGEQVVDYHREERGLWCGDTRIPARVEEISASGNPGIAFSVGEKRFNVPLKGRFDWKSYRLTPVSIEQAPLMTLETAGGEPVETLFIKMGTVPPERDFFLVKTLPHKIYIAPDGDTGLKLRIIRDKIEVVSTTVVWAEKMKYDDHAISFFRGEPWVRIAVEKRVPFWPALAGGGLLVAGLVISLQKRRTQPC